jgi:phosphoribosylformylglycinamidine synthase subunit PurS
MDEIEAKVPTMKAKIKITLKNGVLDPQGKAIEGALGSMGFGGVNGVRQGKYFEIELAETDKAKAEASVKAMCEKLIANTVIENYLIELG